MTTRKKPCPLCREIVPHESGFVCSGCSNHWKILTQMEVALKSCEHVETYYLPVDSIATVWAGNARIEPTFTLALCSMLLAVTNPALPAHADIYHHLPRYQEWYTKAQPRALTPDAAETVRVFFKELQTAMDAIYRCGLKDGKDLLAGLARGTVTLDEINAENTTSTVTAIKCGNK